jgi:hypothetical protein
MSDRLVYLLIGVCFILVLVCCGFIFCCGAYGVPTMCLICKTKVAKVYVDERGNEIENFERHVRGSRPATAEGGEDGLGRAALVHPHPEEEFHFGGVKSPLAGMQSAPAALQEKEATASEQASGGNALLAAMAGDGGGGGGADSQLKADESQASIQLRLQMWCKSLMARSDALRDELGLPAKPAQQIASLLTAYQPLAISEINMLVQFAQEQTEENRSLERKVGSAEPESEDERGGGSVTHGRGKKKNHSSAAQRAKSSSPDTESRRPGSGGGGGVDSDSAEKGRGGRHRDHTGEGDVSLFSEPIESNVSLPKITPLVPLAPLPEKRAGGGAGEGSPDGLSRQALGHQDESKLVSQTPGPEEGTKKEKRNKSEPKAVKIAKKVETLESIAKKDMREDFARKAYKAK